MKKILPALLLFIVLFSVSFKGDYNSERVDLHTVILIKNEGFNNSKVIETLAQLTDEIGPRLTGSDNMKTAERWAKRRLEGWGLQNVQIEPWGGFGKGWQVEKCYIAMTSPYYQQLIAVPKAWTSGTVGLIKADAVFVKIESERDMAKYDGKLKGKIVVLQPYVITDTKPNFTADAKRNSDEDLEKMAMDTHVEDPKPPTPPAKTPLPRRQIDSFLNLQAPAAILSGGRGTMGTLFTSNGASRAWSANPALPELEMGAEHINRLIRLLEAGKTVSLELDIRTQFLTKDSVENNVVAEIPGTDKRLKNEYVMLGAHMDSWQGSTGATDNGCGTAVVMEAVRILKAINIKPRRTIRVILWSGEEQGLLGSRGYVKNHFADRMTMALKPAHAKVSAYFNLDNGGGKIRGIFMQGNDEVKPIFEAWLQPFHDLGATTVTIRNTGSTDHVSFDEVGIPGFQFIQDPLDYGTRTHHTNMDCYDRVNGNDMMQASIIMASFVYHAAMRTKMIPRKPLPKPASAVQVKK